MTGFCLPNHISAEIFLRDYWQKKPLLIRNGFHKLWGNLNLRILLN